MCMRCTWDVNMGHVVQHTVSWIDDTCRGSMWQVRREKILLYCRETPAGPRAGRSDAGWMLVRPESNLKKVLGCASLKLGIRPKDFREDQGRTHSARYPHRAPSLGALLSLFTVCGYRGGRLQPRVHARGAGRGQSGEGEEEAGGGGGEAEERERGAAREEAGAGTRVGWVGGGGERSGDGRGYRGGRLKFSGAFHS